MLGIEASQKDYSERKDSGIRYMCAQGIHKLTWPLLAENTARLFRKPISESPGQCNCNKL